MARKRLRVHQREALTGLAYAALPLLGFTVFFAIPFVLSIVSIFFKQGMRSFIGLANFMSLFQSEAFRLALVNTLRFIITGVPISLVLSLSLALALWRKIKGKRVFRTLFILPLVVPVSSVILVFNIIFERFGIINTILTSLGCDSVNWLHSGSAFSVLILLYVWKNFGYCVVLFLVGLTQIPNEYYEAAKVDGAGSIRTLRTITLPLLSPTFFFTAVISITNVFKSFREAYALFGTYPPDSVYMLQHFMNNNFYNLNYPRLSIASLMTFIIIIAMVFILYRYNRKAGEYL